MSHDLRAPSRAIDGFSQLLMDDKFVGAETRHHLQRIRANVAHMASLIDDLLEFARCGRQSLDFGRLDMEQLARNAAEQARSARPNGAPPPTIEIGSLHLFGVFRRLHAAREYPGWPSLVTAARSGLMRSPTKALHSASRCPSRCCGRLADTAASR